MPLLKSLFQDFPLLMDRLLQLSFFQTSVLGTSGSVVDDPEAAELLKVSYADLVVLPLGCSSFPPMFFSIFKILSAQFAEEFFQ